MTNIVKLGQFLDTGTCGAVYEAKDIQGYVVKIPIDNSNLDIKDEIKNYFVLKLYNEKVFIQSKAVKTNMPGNCTPCLGILRPKITLAKTFSLEQLLQFKDDLISISKKGIILRDNIQAGVEASGKIVIYDIGFVKKGDSSDALLINGYKWERFILRLDAPVHCKALNWTKIST